MQKTKLEINNRRFLYQKYITEKMTGIEIAELTGISERTIYSWLMKLNIPRRKSGVEYWSKEQKEYRRQWNKEHPEINRMKGKRHSEATKKKMSESRQCEKNANWRGGLTEIKRGIKRSPKYYWWRSAVLNRDNEICQLCGRANSREAHHIKPFKEFPELRFDVDNGLTLCFDCHKKIHSKGGILSNAHA